MRKNKSVLFVLLLALGFRLFAIGWDQGFHLHPDERMLVMVADRIHFFRELNPDFFNYGSLPVYLLAGTAQLLDALLGTHFKNYDGLLWVGRSLSAAADVLTVFFIFKISLLLFRKRDIAFYSAALYTIAFFPIQNSHFFVVDVFMNLFVTVTFYLICSYLTKPDLKTLFFLSMSTAASIATKFTAVVFLVPVGLFLTTGVTRRKIRALEAMYVPIFSAFWFFLFMPYAVIEGKRFIADILSQTKMNTNPYIFPYTLQYVGTLPYLYYLKNIFIWGLGPIISVLSLAGLLMVVKWSLRKKFDLPLFFFLFFYLFYFLVIGKSAVKFMRYMLPIYPFFAILAGYTLNKIGNWYASRRIGIGNYLLYGLLTLQTLWTLIFMTIYAKPNTRVSATEWITKNIPYGVSIAVEHWDDRLPLVASDRYLISELTLYDQPDDDMKWQRQSEVLRKSDYIVIASNRLYIPLQKLADCSNYKSCYPKTAEYYRKLFAEEEVSADTRFKKVVEFTSYPRLELGNWKLEIPDDGADESFTVYDHPKIMIFKKSN